MPAGCRDGSRPCSRAVSSDTVTVVPALKNQRWELFCRNLVEGAKLGWPASQAYIRSGYKADDATARANASRLLAKDSIKMRLSELTAPTVKRTRTTIDSLAKQFDDVFDAAISASQLGAAGAAASAKAKLFGFMRDKLEIGGVGSFDACLTLPELVEALLSDQSPAEALETCDALREAIEQHAATHAAIIVPTAPKVDEFAESMRVSRKNGRGH
jgi:hypothetical protein